MLRVQRDLDPGVRLDVLRRGTTGTAYQINAGSPVYLSIYNPTWTSSDPSLAQVYSSAIVAYGTAGEGETAPSVTPLYPFLANTGRWAAKLGTTGT